MSFLSPPALPFTAGHPSRLRLPTTTSGRLSAPVPPHCRRRVQSFSLPPRSNLPSIEQSKLSTSAFDLFDHLLDGALSLLALLRLLPPNFHDRWKHLFELPEVEAEAWLAQLPFHLIQAVTASEDHRFFSHYGVDLHGIARAVVHYPNGGGGSTITQQLVKRIFLTSERKLSRKFVEGVLSLLLEKRISKWKILYSYMRKMYWGHGVYGIESASQFYFGKSPCSLSVGDSAMLAGILPAPEFLNPLTNLKKARSSQAKVLRRMISAGYLEMETALEIAREHFYSSSENKEGTKELIKF